MPKKEGKPQVEWDKYFKRYVWNDRTTPYFTPVDKLHQGQANSEILFYCLLHGVLFSVITLAALRGGPDGRSLGIAYYSFSVVVAAVLFGMLKNYAAALYMSATPLAAILYVLVYRLAAGAPVVDSIVVLGILALLMRYSFRIVAVARSYPDFPPAPPPEPPTFMNFK